LSESYGMECGALSRDWNEEHQSCRELPSASRRDRVLRERTMLKISSDFVEAASKGAVAVVERCIPPINPMDAPAAHMYVYNNIFFSYATSTKEGVAGGGGGGGGGEDGLGDQATYASSNQDLIGVMQYSAAEVPGLFTLATAVVDYRGLRIVAQSIIPGILQGEQLGSLIYGSVDNGSKFVWHEAFHALLQKAAQVLHIKEHAIVDGAGVEHQVCVPVECKGIMGTDNRMYLLDLVRVTPRDPNISQETVSMGAGGAGVLRVELLRQFIYHKKCEAAGKALRELADAPADKSADGDGKAAEDTDADAGVGGKILFNINLDGALSEAGGRSWKLVGDDLGGDEALVREAGAFLVETVIPGLVEQFRCLDISPVDGRQLTESLHGQVFS